MQKKFKSKDEERFYSELSLLKKAGEIRDFEYEVLSFEIGVSRSYTPDFIVDYEGRAEVIEVKGYPIIINPKTRRRVPIAEKIKRDWGISKFMCIAHFYEAPLVHKTTYYRLIEWKNKQWETVFLITNRRKLNKKEMFPLHAKYITEAEL